MSRGLNAWTTSTNAFVAAFTAATDGNAKTVKVRAKADNGEELLVKVTDTAGTVTLDILEAGEKEYYGAGGNGIGKVEVKSTGGTAKYIVTPIASVIV
jgi:hypothetical protein